MVQGGSQKLLLATKESIVSSSIFSGPPCIILSYPHFIRFSIENYLSEFYNNLMLNRNGRKS